MSKFEDVFQGVLKEIKPKNKKVVTEAKAFVKKLNELVKKNKVKAKVVMAGSLAKDTYLVGNHDCDIFVRFDKKYKDSDLSKELQKILKPLKPVLVHGSRDYFNIKNGINYEIVPVLDIAEPDDAVNVTDMSPLHVDWVKKHPELVDDIRLAKQFCKSIKVYGAESYIKGFSGHVLDILVIHYGGFLKLLRASAKWKDKQVIDPEKYYRGNALTKLNKSKIDSPIIVIDPVLKERNAAAALSSEKLELFKVHAAEFLKNPSPDFFTIHDLTLDEIKKSAGKNKLIVIDVDAHSGKEDVVGAKLLKAFTQLTNQLNFYDFKLIDSGWQWNKKRKAIFWFVLDPKNLVAIKKWVGPPAGEKDRVLAFKKKYQKTFVEHGRVCTYVKRAYVDADKLIDDIIKKDELIYEKVKSMKKVR